MTTPKLLCLLPVRNAAEDLPGWLESASVFADAVVALDDGSTDATGDILRAHPLVSMVLANPRRATYEGWDDAANRNRLLSAAHAFEPEWIMSLDADERLSPDDGRALRRFVERDALAGFAYGFQVCRMVGDLDHYDRHNLRVYRLFAFEAGQRFPDRRLHFVPVPTTITRERWLDTTLRIQHLASLTERRRQQRFQKYVEADPGLEFQNDYGHLLDPPDEVKRWVPRPVDLPVLADGTENSGPWLTRSTDDPVLSAVVIARNDEHRIEAVVRSVVEQQCPEPFEVIVVASGTDRTAAIVRETFPAVRLVELARPALPGEARNAGWRLARGRYISFPGSHIELPPGSLAARMAAHDAGWAMVTGTTLNGTRTVAGWASYFLDHSTVLPGRPSEELAVAPAHCSYLRLALEDVEGFPENLRAGEDTVVNRELFARGYPAYRASTVRLTHNSPCRTPWRLVRHHFTRGRGLGRIILSDYRDRGRVLNRALVTRLAVSYVPTRVRNTTENVRRWGGDLRGAFRRAFPLVVLGAVSACSGTWYELLRPGRGKLRILLGRPALTVAIAGLDRRGTDGDPGRADALVIVRLDLIQRVIRVVSLPRDLLVDLPGVGLSRLNETWAFGARRDDGTAAARLLGEAVERLAGVHLDGVVTVDFDGCRRFIDSLGGIELEIAEAISDPLASEGVGLVSAVFEPGRQRLSGAQLVAYARTRHDGDVRRRNRHLQVITAVYRQLTRIRSPFRLARVMQASRRSVTTTLPVPAKITLLLSLPRLASAKIETASVRWPLTHAVTLPDNRQVLSSTKRSLSEFVRQSLGFTDDDFSRGDHPAQKPTHQSGSTVASAEKLLPEPVR